MANPRDKFIQIIDDLKLPISQKELEKRLEKINDNEVGLLVSRYVEIKKYFDDIEKLAHAADAGRYSKELKSHNRKLLKLQNENSQKMEIIQKEADDKLDDVESKAREDYDNLLKSLERDLGNLEDNYKKLFSKASS